MLHQLGLYSNSRDTYAIGIRYLTRVVFVVDTSIALFQSAGVTTVLFLTFSLWLKHDVLPRGRIRPLKFQCLMPMKLRNIYKP